MMEFLNTYAAEIAQGAALLAIASPFIKQRLLSDKNILNVFQTAKDAIEQNNTFKIDISSNISRINQTIEKIREQSITQTKEFERIILEFQEDELYQKMLSGLSELDELHQTLQNKDATIEMLTKEIRDIHVFIQEFKNASKE